MQDDLCKFNRERLQLASIVEHLGKYFTSE